MKTLVEKWTLSDRCSFTSKQYVIKTDFVRSPEILMRSHEEDEISVLVGYSGKRFAGNTIENFSEGDMFLIGPHVLHAVQPDDYGRGTAITLRFLKEGFGTGFFDLAENRQIASLLQEARRGVAFAGSNIPLFYQKLREIIDQSGFEHANMSPTSFCRYFKKHFRKTFTNFLNEVRVGHACKLLQQTDRTVAEIAFASGYNQLTHFNRQFKRIVGYCPRAYRSELNQQSA